MTDNSEAIDCTPRGDQRTVDKISFLTALLALKLISMHLQLFVDIQALPDARGSSGLQPGHDDPPMPSGLVENQIRPIPEAWKNPFKVQEFRIHKGISPHDPIVKATFRDTVDGVQAPGHDIRNSV